MQAFFQLHRLRFRQIFFENFLDDAAAARSVEHLKLESGTLVVEKILGRNEKLDDKNALPAQIFSATEQAAQDFSSGGEQVQSVVGDKDGIERPFEGWGQHIHAKK